MTAIDIEIIVKLLIACSLGGVIGFFRERERKAAGLRTHILVCMGSALFTIISICVAREFPGSDVTRIASNIIVGIGFIGAGTIIHGAEGSIIGITTAASIWMAAAIGMSIGFGLYIAGSSATLITFLVVHLLHRIEKKYIRKEE